MGLFPTTDSEEKDDSLWDKYLVILIDVTSSSSQYDLTSSEISKQEILTLSDSSNFNWNWPNSARGTSSSKPKNAVLLKDIMCAIWNLNLDIQSFYARHSYSKENISDKFHCFTKFSVLQIVNGIYDFFTALKC